MPLLLLLLALFVFPIAVYCTVLGMINRRPRALMVSGRWDFLAVLLATSGFLLFLGPALLSGTFRDSLQELPFQRGAGNMAEAVASVWASWWVAWLLYYGFVLGGATYLVWARRDTTVIYNIDPDTLDHVLARLAERLGLRASRLGNRLFLGISDVPMPLSGVAAEKSEQITANPRSVLQPGRPLGDQMQVTIDVEPFEKLSNAALHWRSASPTARATLERELRQVLAEVAVPETAVSSWLLGISTLLFLIIMMLTAVFVLGAFIARRGP